MTLLELPSGLMSLEYAVDEQCEVRARLAAIAKVSVVDRTTYAEVTVGKVSFIHISDWDDPCLIAQSADGNAILKLVYDSGTTHASIAAE